MWIPKSYPRRLRDEPFRIVLVLVLDSLRFAKVCSGALRFEIAGRINTRCPFQALFAGFGGRYGIATGTGSFYPGASDENTVKVYDTKCNQVWSDTLDGSTGGSPALADVQGNGQLAVVGDEAVELAASGDRSAKRARELLERAAPQTGGSSAE